MQFENLFGKYLLCTCCVPGHGQSQQSCFVGLLGLGEWAALRGKQGASWRKSSSRALHQGPKLGREKTLKQPPGSCPLVFTPWRDPPLGGGQTCL